MLWQSLLEYTDCIYISVADILIILLKMIALFISDFGHIKDVVGTTRLNRPSLKVTSPESPNTQKTQKNAMQISGRIQVSLLNFPLLFFFYYDLYMSNTVVSFRAIFCVIL